MAERATTDARIVRTREALHRAMLSLLERKPLDQITIREITAEANVGYATFFRHHPTKDALLEDIARAEIEGLVALSLPLFEATDGRASCAQMCRTVMAHRSLWTALLTGGAAGTLREEFIRISRAVAARVPVAAPWLPTDLGVVHSSSAIVEILAWWLREEEPMPIDRIAEIIHRLVIVPLDYP